PPDGHGRPPPRRRAAPAGAGRAWLAGACAQAADRLTAGTELTASVLAPDDLPALPAVVEVAAYRIVVEAVTKNRPARPRAALPGVHQPPRYRADHHRDRRRRGSPHDKKPWPRPGHHAG